MTIWKKIRKLMIVVKYNTINELKDYRTAIMKAGLNVHECSLLCITDSKKEIVGSRDLGSVVFLSTKEYNILGSLKNEAAIKLFASKFDAVIYIGDSSRKIERSVKKVMPKVKIGLNTNKAEVDIILKSDSDKPVHLINFVKETLEKIS